MARVSSTMVNAIPFLWLRGGTHPLAVGPVNPGLLHRTGRSDRHAGGCQITWDPADESLAGQPERASADSEVRPGPRPRPYAHTTAKRCKQGRKHYPHPPCRLCALWRSTELVADARQIDRLCVPRQGWLLGVSWRVGPSRAFPARQCPSATRTSFVASGSNPKLRAPSASGGGCPAIMT
jgi:hypothetical protein